jgi:hypothetical protein
LFTPVLETLEGRWLPSTSLALKIEFGSTSVVINDGGPGDLDGAVNNQIIAQSGIAGVPTIPGFRLVADSSLTNTPGDAGGALLQTNYTLAATSSGAGGGTVTITTSATGFDQPPAASNPLTLVSQLNGNGSGTGTITGQGWADTSNGLFGMGPNTGGPQGPFNINASGGYSSQASSTFNRGAGSFSLTDQIIATLSDAASTTGSLQETVATPVRSAHPLISTVAGGTVVIGSGAKLNDTALLSGGSNPTGTITFTLYNPSNVPVYTDVVTVNGNGSYDTTTGTNPGGYLPTVAGTYLWTAVYSGDSNNNGAADNGEHENETVISPGSISGEKFLAVPTPGESCRMTGGGSVFTVASDFGLDSNGMPLAPGTRITHGFEIHCDPNNTPNRIEVNWGGGQNFHLDNLDQIICYDDPAISPTPPNAMCDTFIGEGHGKFNGVDGATIWFTFTDAGEPGSSDTAAYLIKDAGGNTVLSVGQQPAAITHALAAPTLQFGNQQSHKEHAASFSGGTTDVPWTIPGVTILLLDSTQTQLISTTTLDSNGHFEFDNLSSGNYVIAEEFPSAYQQVSPSSGTAITYGPPLVSGDVIGPWGFTVTVTPGQDTPVGAPFVNEAKTMDDCRWTGGGSIFTASSDFALATDGSGLAAGTRITHGFELHCDLSSPNNLEINWGGGQNFHLTSLTNAVCFDDPSISPTPPQAPCNTIEAAGIGSFDNVDGYRIEFTFTDAGEPGKQDKASYLIWKDQSGGTDGIYDPGIDTLVLQVGPKQLTFGNQQAHKGSGGGSAGPAIVSGQFASTSFWSNAKGQSAIQSFDGGSTDTALGNWLATNFPNLFGNSAGPVGNLAGKTNAQVAQLYKNLNTNGIANNTFVQAAAVALGIYADTTGLGGAELVAQGLAAKYGITVTTAGGAGSTISDAASAPAFGTISKSAISAWQVLKTVDANYNPQAQSLFGGDSVGLSMASDLLSRINAGGNIALVTPDGVSTGDAPLASSLHPLLSGTLLVAVDPLPAGDTANEQARIDDALSQLNAALGQFGVTLVEEQASDSTPADIHLSFSDTCAIGGVANGVLGVTQAGGEITIVTGWNYYFGSDPAGIGAGQYDFETVVVHELGHAIGLGHSTSSASVMYPYLAMHDVRHTLTSTDLSQIQTAENGPEPLLASGFTAPGIRVEAANAASFAAESVYSAAVDSTVEFGVGTAGNTVPTLSLAGVVSSGNGGDLASVNRSVPTNSAAFSVALPAASIMGPGDSGTVTLDPVSGRLPLAPAARPGFYSAWLAETDTAGGADDIGGEPLGAGRAAASAGASPGGLPGATPAAVEVAATATPSASFFAQMLGIGLFAAEVKLRDEEEEGEEKTDDVDADDKEPVEV